MTNFTESELIPVALKIILNKLNGIETKDLIIELRNLMSPSCEDLEMLSNRNDDKFSQKVRNIKSHKTLENKGYVKFYDNKFFITEEGVKYLDQISWRDLDKIYSNIEVNHKQNENSDLSKPASNILKENEITLNNKEYLFEALSKKLKPQPEINKKLLKKLDGFFLTSRTLNCLKNENIVYVGDLIQLTENYLLKSNNFGRKSLEDLKNILSSMSLYLGMELSNWDSLREKLIHKDKLSEINFSHEDIDGKKKVFNGKKSIFENFETSRKFNLQKKIFIDVNLKIIDVEKLIIQDIEIILSQLNIKYKNLFKYRYAYLEEFKTLEEAGIIYGVTRERIRQLERDINKSLSYIGLIDKNSLIEYFENMKNLSFHKFFPSLSKNFRKLPRSKGTHDIGKNGLANFMENFCGVKEGFFKTTERVLSDFDTFKLQDIFLVTPSGNDGESFLEIIQDYYGYDKFSANSAIELMVEKKLIKIVDNKIYAIKMNKNLEVAHILLNYPDGLHWKKISKLGNNSYTENKWSTNRIMADPSISMNVNNFIYLSNIGTHKLLKFCKELKKKKKLFQFLKIH